jgi:hypothetical protein
MTSNVSDEPVASIFKVEDNFFNLPTLECYEFHKITVTNVCNADRCGRAV